MLAQVLGKLEATQQPGYGVGHDLFGVMWLDAGTDVDVCLSGNIAIAQNRLWL